MDLAYDRVHGCSGQGRASVDSVHSTSVVEATSGRPAHLHAFDQHENFQSNPRHLTEPSPCPTIGRSTIRVTTHASR